MRSATKLLVVHVRTNNYATNVFFCFLQYTLSWRSRSAVYWHHDNQRSAHELIGDKRKRL
jgi:hypothetical protein